MNENTDFLVDGEKVAEFQSFELAAKLAELLSKNEMQKFDSISVTKGELVYTVLRSKST